MVAVIKTGHSLNRILNYNENKVREGLAECIGEGNYPLEVHQMSFSMKLNRLSRQARLNPNVTRLSVHISLNFDVSEKDMQRDKLLSIASDYMEGIGFGNQPYLVYQHHDAGHPHMHIVSVKVRPDGSRIDMQNIGKNQSETARQLIEKKYGLVVAAAKNNNDQKFSALSLSKVIYGRNDTRRAITNILDAVIPHYKYTSLSELNAILKQYNIMADSGSEKSRVYQNKGLLYRILDENGNKVGIPLKASSIYSKPTLPFLEKRFLINEAARASYKGRIKNAIDRNFLGSPSIGLSAFCKALEKDGIHTVLRQSQAGQLYGITYIDHVTKCVFNGSSLGKQYSAKAIQERLQIVTAKEDKNKENDLIISKGHHLHKEGTDFSISGSNTLEQALLAVSRPENTSDYMPREFKKRKKKRGQSDNR